ncbi:MAG: DnaJ domain-containing protein [Deltaproteobacteria bacterium]|nr:DnaJ domain-containing protein [Deltaproteobacteria bacterium]
MRCLACGTTRMKSGRRYCSKECRRHINWVLSLSKGLLKALNARYAAFSFTSEEVVLDVFPVWSNKISRFSLRRRADNKPADDLKNLVLQYGTQWHQMVNSNRSKSYASLHLVTQNHRQDVHPNVIKPDSQSRPRLSKVETGSLKILRLHRSDLADEGRRRKIRTAYKKMAKIHHPDVGGDEEKFKKLKEAHEQMILWAENPQYTSRKALEDCWSYDGATSRWAPPL